MTSANPTWSSPPESLMISKGQLHVWRADLDLPEACLTRLHLVLSPEEMDRAKRFYFPKDRDRFIVSHACVRDVLSGYLQVKPEQIKFITNSFGKPALAADSEGKDLEFNLSHSNRFALLAVSQGMRVGVDVEFIRMEFGGVEIARRFFSPSEVQALLSLPTELQSEAFFRCWTRKEAYIKGKGRGLSLPLDEFDVSVLPGEPAALLNTRPDPGDAARWSMFQVDPAPGYSGTVAVEGHSMELNYWEWVP